MIREKNFFSKFFNSKLFISAIIVIISVLSFNLFTQSSKSKEVENKIEKIKKDITDMEKENSGLSDLIGYFNSDLFVEKEARIKLGLKKEGESVIIIDNSSSEQKIDNPIAADTSPLTKEKKSNLSLWWDYFFVK